MEKTVADPTSRPTADPFHPAGTFSLSAHARQLEDAMNPPKTPVNKPTDLPVTSSGTIKGAGPEPHR